ncbi:protein TAPETUM DETERMINANT 1-like [Quillaja saponaria]|uniref:Protein TAPETUM DETERMINANT 1-like n=1 Tax=Quillaja saponaria TaxID=32244 RepID=A0AAD7LCK8_QUISA|nr:protein TAPETUM DETERMINANT 1-like [Quillaja saponaria]
MTKMTVLKASCHLFFLCLMIPSAVFCTNSLHSEPSKQLLHSFHEDNNQSTTVSMQSEEAHFAYRKLLLHETCTNRDISISQSKDSTSGIPQYIVQIVNTCVAGCAPSNIRIHCGWFASARMVNPRFFKRLSYDDCLVNGGKPLDTSEVIRFTYSNSFKYPLAFKSAKF